MNPREYPHLGTMICFHIRYDLGDYHPIRRLNYTNWQDMAGALVKEFNAAVILPLYLLDHSSISLSTHPFNNMWDSGQVGYILVSKPDVAKWFGTKYCTKALIKKATAILMNEVDDYNVYLENGDDE